MQATLFHCVSFSEILTYTFLIPAVILEGFIVIKELATPTGIPTKEAKEEIETNLVTVQAKINKCSI